MIRRTVPRALLVLALAVPLAACGSDDSGGGSASAASSAPACTSQEPTVAAPSEVSSDLGEKPTWSGTDQPPPCGLQVSDVVTGTGPVAKAGSSVAVKYVGAFYETGEEFDSSWSRGADDTLPVTLGAGQVIEGFDQGITGMAVGGRRVVVIPSDLGYGPVGQGPIPGGATLVFIIDLVSVG